MGHDLTLLQQIQTQSQFGTEAVTCVNIRDMDAREWPCLPFHTDHALRTRGS